ncbi:MAG TPA: sensor domain-containing diguanylate cyclase [Jatrophihabitans sp.]|nr:sensor domain-containing diguanylate cyclase [Jatrophihabitans sp.]
MRAPLPLNEDARVAALQRLGILDQPAAPDLDTLSRLAAYVTGTQFGAINLIDTDQQRQVSASTGAPADCPRQDSICQYTVYENRTLHVPNAALDPRFEDNPYVSGLLDRVALYCGVPLRDLDGFVLGSLCVTDPQPRELSDAQVGALEDLARQVEQLFEMRRQHSRLLDVLAQVDHLAVHDPLTGLVNRRMLADRLEHAISRAQRPQSVPVVFFCDLDGFKAVNDSLGHQAGDEVLVEVAHRLTALMRPSDTVARVGGDEFLVLCEDIPAENHEVVADRLRSAGHTDITTWAGPARVGISVGFAQATAGRGVSDVLNEADRGMYLDKLSRRGVA